MERAAQAELGKLQNAPSPSRAALDAAISHEQTTGARLDALWKERRALEALPDPKPPGMVSRLLGRVDGAGENTGHEVARAQIAAQLVTAERGWLAARASVDRAERAHRAAGETQRSQTEQLASAARATIDQVRTTKRIVHYYPRLAYGGPSFVHSVGRQVDRRRYRLNPLARDIWGMPIEP